MPNNSNISEEDYLDSLLRAVSAGKDDFEIDDDLELDEDFDEQFEAEFEAELKAEFATKNEDIEIKEKKVNNTMAASNSIFTDDEELSEEEIAFSTEIKNSVLSSVMKHEKDDAAGDEKEEAEKKSKIKDKPEAEKKSEIKDKPEAEETAEINEKAESEFQGFFDQEPEQYQEEEDITNHLAAILGGSGDTEAKVDKVKPTKEEIKAEKARIKANRKAAKEAAKIARQADKARKAAAKIREKQEENDLVDSMADIFDSANEDLRKEYDENPSKRGRSAEEKSIDNSVDAELADLGLDALFNQIGHSVDEPVNEPAATETKNFFEQEDFDEEEPADKNAKAAKKKKEKKPKKKKEKKPKPPKKKKTPKPKKVKAPDEIIPIPAPLLIFGLSLTALLVVAVTIGGNTYYYNTCMDRAVNYYVNKNYQAAYREISGLKIKEKDEFFYEQVKVVMTVESNYDMFKSMMRIGEYDEALDLLLKGVDNFDLYQNEARDWEAFDDLEVSLRRVVAALEKYYGITESQAREINLIEGRLEYSKKIAELAANVEYDINEPFADETTTAPETTTGMEDEEGTGQSEEETSSEN